MNPCPRLAPPHATVVVAEKLNEIQIIVVETDVTGHMSGFKVEDTNAYAADPQSVQGVERQ